MTMTYAAQVRSMSKSLPKQTLQDDLYDINSLRIICQYFVGSNVVIKTVDEILEGILHTISNNTICLTLVTITKIDNPDKITKVSPSKLVSLNDVLCLTAMDSSDIDVTVKGKYIKNIPEMNNNNVNMVATDHCNVSKPLSVKSQKAVLQVEESKNAEVTEKCDIIDTVVISGSGNSEDKIESDVNVTAETKPIINEPKKGFTFNPNAPEFKPRSSVTYSDSAAPEPMLFSPQPQPFPQVFAPNSAPAIFVPNLFFYAPNHHLNNIDGASMDNSNFRLQPTINSNERFTPLSDFHVPNHPLPFVPIFQHQLPTFIPNAPPYRLRKGHVYTSESSNNTENTETIDNELSNPSNWPPLPNPGQGPQPTAASNVTASATALATEPTPSTSPSSLSSLKKT